MECLMMRVQAQVFVSGFLLYTVIRLGRSHINLDDLGAVDAYQQS